MMQWKTEKWATRGFVFLLAYAMLRSLFYAAARPFWYDELCTVFVSRLPLSVIWTALRHAADSQPAPYYLLERIVTAVLSNDALAFRLPSVLGLCCTIVCVFFFVRRRASGAVSLTSCALLLLSVLFTNYAAEARGYSLMVGGIAFALVCYQRADSRLWALMMGLSLAAATVFNYYAIFVVFPFALAEIALLVARGRLRLRVWIALVIGVAPLGWLWPFLAGLKQYYGAHFVAPASLATALNVYGWFLQLPAQWGLAILAAAGLVLLRLLTSWFRSAAVFDSSETTMHEDVLLCGLLLLPLCILVAMKLTHGGLNDRYMLPGMLALPLVLGRVLERLPLRSVTATAIVLFVAIGFQEVAFWRGYHLGRNSPAQAIQTFVNSAGRSDLPVVVSNGQDYLQLAYYSPESSGGFVSVVDPRAAAEFSGSNTADLQLLALRNYVPLSVLEFDEFAASHSEFLLYSRDWWPARLLRDGYTLQTLAHRESGAVYLVRRASLVPGH